jgi:hypothetical protein
VRDAQQRLVRRVPDAALDLAQQAGADAGTGGQRFKAVPFTAGEADEAAEALHLAADGVVSEQLVRGGVAVPSTLLCHRSLLCPMTT